MSRHGSLAPSQRSRRGPRRRRAVMPHAYLGGPVLERCATCSLPRSRTDVHGRVLAGADELVGGRP